MQHIYLKTLLDHLKDWEISLMSFYCNYQHHLHHSVPNLPEVNLVGE